MACDTCGRTGTPLVDLLSIYQTDKVKQVCRECETVINRQLWNAQDVTGKIQRSLMTRFLDHLRWRNHSQRHPCSQPGCIQTDGAPCAYPQCPQRSAQG
jgi:hypothetical protein